MALSRLNYNSLNVTPTASAGIGFDSGADDLSIDFSGGDLVFIKKLTASGSATLSFVDGSSDVVLDNTYKEYLFTFKNIHASELTTFTFNGSIDSGSNYNVAKTSAFFGSYHNETAAATSLHYRNEQDQSQGTGFQQIQWPDGHGTDNDLGSSGYLRLFNPSSTTFVKHYIGRANLGMDADYTIDAHVAGYFNTTSAIDACQFKMAEGNIDLGDICLYGIN